MQRIAWALMEKKHRATVNGSLMGIYGTKSAAFNGSLMVINGEKRETSGEYFNGSLMGINGETINGQLTAHTHILRPTD